MNKKLLKEMDKFIVETQQMTKDMVKQVGQWKAKKHEKTNM